MILRKKHYLLFAFTIFSLLLRYLANICPEIVEQVYSRGLFLGVRFLIDNTIAWFPFPLIYLFFITVAILFIIWIRKLFRRDRILKVRLLKSSLSLLSFFCILVVSFLWLWGFNYARVPIETQLNFEAQALKKSELEKAMKDLTPILTSLRNQIPNVSDEAIDESFLPNDFEKLILSKVRRTLIQNNFPAGTKVNARLLKPKGVLRRMSASGIYFPFVGESNMDTAMHPLQWPEILAHEFSHAYGFGDEGTCSFIAYLCLHDDEDPFLRYGSLLEYWRTLASNYLRYEPQAYQEYRASLPKGLVNDLNAINERSREYPDWFPKFRTVAYDSYLKAQGIDEGLENYNRVIMLVEGWRRKEL